MPEEKIMANQNHSDDDPTQPSPGAGSPQQHQPLDGNRRGYGGSVGEISPQVTPAASPTSPSEGTGANPNTSGRQAQGGMERQGRGDHHDVNEQAQRSQDLQGSVANGGYPIGSFDQSSDASSEQRGQSDTGGAQRNESIESPSDTGVER